MLTIFRLVLAVVAGLVVAFGLVIAVELWSSVAHPFPEGFDQNDFGQLCEHVRRYPQWFLAVAAILYGGINLLGSWLAKWIGNLWCGLIVALLLLTLAIINVTMVPYPTWFKILTPILQLVALVLMLCLPGRMSPTSSAVGLAH